MAVEEFVLHLSSDMILIVMLIAVACFGAGYVVGVYHQHYDSLKKKSKKRWPN